MNIRLLQENETEHTFFAGWGSGSRVRSTWGTHQPPNYESDYKIIIIIIVILIIIIILTILVMVTVVVWQ